MNAYAPNDSSSGGGYAALTSSLLARKGEALPAVDAVAHEGVDIEMRPMRPANSPGAPKNISEDAIEKMYPDNPAPEMRSKNTRRPGVRLVHPVEKAAAQDAEATDAPAAWTIAPKKPAQRRLPPPGAAYAANAPTGVLARRAIVTLRMPARDLVRLRLASRDLEMSCQAIILDALECYLDANDVPSASDDAAIRREVERLMAKAKAKRGG